MIEDRLGSSKGLQFPIKISWCGAAWGTDYLIFAIKNDDETTGIIGELAKNGIIGPTNSCVKFLAGEYRTANHGAGDGNRLPIFSLQGKAPEAVILPRCNQEGGLIDARAKVYGDTVCRV